MPRPKTTVPAYRHHKATNRAVVYVDRREIYLGVYGSPESRQKYAELVSRLTGGDPLESSSRTPASPAPIQRSIAGLCLRFIAEKLPSYAQAEQNCQRLAIKILSELFGETPTSEFGPLRLRAVRNAMISGDPMAKDAEGKPKPRKPWSRSFINKQIKRLRHLFKWGVSWELVPQTVADSLGSLESLTVGESDAPEGRPRRAVSLEKLQAVRAVLCERHRDLFDLLLLTGARPGELVGLTMGQIDRSGDVWRADLARHKTAHKGKSRTLFFNATAQAILVKYLQADPAARLFPLRRDTLGAAVKSACERAFGMPDDLRNPDKNLSQAKLEDVKAQAMAWRREHVFTPHWLRHTVATRLADELGTEAAQRLLGHAGRAMTEHYSRAAEKVAIDAAKRLG